MILFIPDMAGRLFLLILLFDTFQFLKAKDLPQPSLTVIPAVIKERDSVQLNCQTPPPVFECYFKIEGKVEFTLSSPCQQTLTGTLLVRWTGQSSPAEVKIQCQYSAKGSQFRSIYSEPSTVTITDLPQLTVSSTVIRETESVQLSCETPPSLPVSHCYFNIEGGENPPDSSCTQTITGTELLKRSGPTFPAVVKVTCYYTVWKSHTSPFSDPVSVTVQDPKPDITVHFDEDFNIICLIPGSVSPDTTCNLYVGEESQPSFTAKIMKRKATSASKQWFCQFTPKHSDLISRLQSVRRKEVSCDYRLSSGPNSLSPRSDGYSFTVSLTPGPRSTLPPSTTASPTEDTTVTPSTSLTSPLTPSRAVNPSSDPMMCFASGSTVCSTLTTDTPASPTERGQSSTESEVESNSQESILLGQLWQAAVGVASGMGVFLVGLTAVCLCRRTKKTNSQRPTARQDDHRQYDLVSMGAVSSGVMVDSGDAGNDSQITSVLSMFMPSGPVDVDTQAFANEHSDTYHIYSSIPDRPASSAQSDGLYSLLQTH
ncbi:mucin-3A isoform X7 [Oncorhynchus tshawytscha]|uniref:mucin-3A isoform X7 n=1 Tax=Oncorhynchus tshawytscha TaxID=74940 RepID=UPI001C3C58A6|nr:mucin-3A isoform X7 [Oncorhynchus tshawytscha]